MEENLSDVNNNSKKSENEVVNINNFTSPKNKSGKKGINNRTMNNNTLQQFIKKEEVDKNNVFNSNQNIYNNNDRNVSK